MRVGDRGGGPGAQLWGDRRGEAVGGGGADAETVAVAVAVEAGERWHSWKPKSTMALLDLLLFTDGCHEHSR